MTLIDYCSHPAPGQAENEDAVYVNANFIAVLDGASTPPGVQTGCIHSPAWYARRLASQLGAANRQSPSAALVEVLSEAIRSVNQDHADTCDLSHPGSPSAAVGLLRIGGQQAEYLVLGDVTIVLDLSGAIEVFTDERFGQAVAEIRKHAFGGNPDIGEPDQLQRITQAAISRQKLTNRPDGYWIAATDPTAAHHAITGTAPMTGRAGLSRAALLTDGAADAVDRYQIMDWPRLLNLVQTDGPRALIWRVRTAENADHDGRTWPRYKRHDDATIVYCRLAGRYQ